MHAWLISPPAAVGFAAALGLGVFIGHNWEQIKERVKEFQEVNKLKWNSAAVDLTLYNPTEMSDNEKEDAIREENEQNRGEEGAFTSAAQFATSSTTTRNREGSFGMPSDANTSESDYASSRFPQHEMSDFAIESESEAESFHEEHGESFVGFSDSETVPDEESAVEFPDEVLSSFDELSEFDSHSSLDSDVHPH